MPLRLSPADYHTLLEVAHSSHDPRQLHRAQALLWLHEGDTVDEVATRLFVTPRTVFRWRSRFDERQALEVPDRLADGPRSGRPKTVAGIIDTLLSEVIDDDPRQLGYHSTVWTAPLLRQRSSVAERYNSCRQYRYNVVAHIPLEQPDETPDPVPAR